MFLNLNLKRSFYRVKRKVQDLITFSKSSSRELSREKETRTEGWMRIVKLYLEFPN